MKLIFLGDIVGKGGREAVKKVLPELKKRYNAAFAVVNAENIAAGCGMTGKCLDDLEAADAITSGDHVWDQKGFDREIPFLPKVVRPANLSQVQPGVGWRVYRNVLSGDVAVINLMGKVFMRESANCPFETAEKILTLLPPSVKTILVDFHAEATSEKLAMGYFLDGKVTAVIGTHTHVQTNDAQVLPGGTAYLSDAGMVGAGYSVLGRDVKAVLRKFRSGMPERLPVVETGIVLCGAVVTYQPSSGRAEAIEPIRIKADDFGDSGL